jgi:hypothetical protein
MFDRLNKKGQPTVTCNSWYLSAVQTTSEHTADYRVESRKLQEIDQVMRVVERPKTVRLYTTLSHSLNSRSFTLTYTVYCQRQCMTPTIAYLHVTCTVNQPLLAAMIYYLLVRARPQEEKKNTIFMSPVYFDFCCFLRAIGQFITLSTRCTKLL